MFLITGFPRSGTQYTARLLSFAGFKVGHEQEREDGLVSWEHLMGAKDYKPVLHQVRHPLDTIASALTINQSSINKLAQRTPNEGYSKLEFLMRSWLDWNEWAQEVSSFTYRVEDIDEVYPIIFTYLERSIPDELPRVSEKINSRPHPELDWEKLFKVNDKVAYRIVKKAQEYGFCS